MKRPVGVTILAVIAIIYGVLSLLLALLGLLGSALKASDVAPSAIHYSIGTLAYATIWDAVLGVLFLVFGIGSFGLKGWAWVTGIVALVLYGVYQIAGVIIQGFSASKIVVAVITIVIALLLLWYLFRPSVRAAFGKAA
ncbi:MAG TPA: hypothetical protein VKQ36_01950 [Ktedonobacterales bacterium]|nr:hypothetical protein [Ktedonobacterales bacterium]